MKMIKKNQKGIAHIFILIILLAGLAVGLYLVQKTQVFKPKATFNPRAEFLDSSGNVIAQTSNPNVRLKIIRDVSVLVSPTPTPIPTPIQTPTPTPIPTPITTGGSGAAGVRVQSIWGSDFPSEYLGYGEGSAYYRPELDLNADGIIDSTDANLFTDNPLVIDGQSGTVGQ